jgi:pyruvate formate lyase activating enzyme
VGQTGICGVRRNTGKGIELLTYNVLSGYAVDPVEKKPLYHFFPGRNILSLGSYGCNMRCDFCQNYHISQNVPKSIIPDVKVNRIITDALSTENNIGIAFTYNEPVIWFEFMRDIASKAKQEDLRCVMVSNGYVSQGVLDSIINFIDAFNIDLKAFNNTFYRNLTGAELEPVKASLKKIADSGRHLEVTTLIIPGQNDSEEEMLLQTEWMANELGPDTPFHLSKYFPTYKRNDPSPTEDSLKKLSEIASKNLNYVYVGNSTSVTGHNTICHSCGTVVTTRTGYVTRLMNLNEEGKCVNCGNPVYKDFIFS